MSNLFPHLSTIWGRLRERPRVSRCFVSGSGGSGGSGAAGALGGHETVRQSCWTNWFIFNDLQNRNMKYIEISWNSEPESLMTVDNHRWIYARSSSATAGELLFSMPNDVISLSTKAIAASSKGRQKETVHKDSGQLMCRAWDCRSWSILILLWS